MSAERVRDSSFILPFYLSLPFCLICTLMDFLVRVVYICVLAQSKREHLLTHVCDRVVCDRVVCDSWCIVV